jgi:carboxypeptidase Taq
MLLEEDKNKMGGSKKSMGNKSSYLRLEKLFDRLTNINDAILYLRWDRCTMMPEGGAKRRSEQVAELETLMSEFLTAPEVGDLIGEAGENQSVLDDWEKANLREMKRLWMHAASIPKETVTALSHINSKCEGKWYSARKDGSFKDVLPEFREVVKLTKEVATAKSEVFGLSKFDVLYDELEPGGASEKLDVVFGDLEKWLPEFILKVQDKQNREFGGIKPKRPRGPFPIASQKALGHRLMECVGFDFNHGRVDPVMHPFCGGAPEDLRITTHYDENDFAHNVTAIMHETGHAMYKFDLPARWRNQPVGRARGQGIHESQSLMLERLVTYSEEFLSFATPLFKEYLGADNSKEWNVDNLRRSYCWVEPTYIRIRADEVTYPCHVILRYKIEKALLEGELAPEDLPDAFNEEMRKLLGIVPRNDREGCLQDIHWYDGTWGYFPTYTIGAINSTQIFATIKKQIPDLMERIKNGDFITLMSWLNKNVHSRASFLSQDELMTEITGKPMDVNIYKDYLTKRYLGS